MAKSIRRELFLGIAVTVLGGLLLNYLAGVSPKAIILWMWEFSKACGSILAEKASIPKWLLGILIMLAVLFIAAAVKEIFHSVSEPTYWDYTEDHFDGVNWRWFYEINGRIKNLWCYCPTCDTSLVYSEQEDRGYEFGSGKTFTSLRCERCGTERARLDGTKDYAVSRISRQIDRSIRVGDWKKVVAKKKTGKDY